MWHDGYQNTIARFSIYEIEKLLVKKRKELF